MSVIVGAWPIGAVFAAVVLRLLEHRIIAETPRDHELARPGQALVELLSVTSQVFIVAAGVGFGIAWSPFRWW